MIGPPIYILLIAVYRNIICSRSNVSSFSAVLLLIPIYYVFYFLANGCACRCTKAQFSFLLKIELKHLLMSFISSSIF